MEKVVFADTFTKNLKRIFKVPTVTVDNPYFQLHYKVTGLSLLFSSIIVTGNQFFGEPIRCIQRDDVPEKLLNTYCWIEGTFSLPKAYNKKVGTEIVYEGVEKYRKGDAVIEHAYYQWVCFVLFLQALMFCFPYVLLRSFDGGKIKNLVRTLKHPIWDAKESKMKPLLKTLQSLFMMAEDSAVVKTTDKKVDETDGNEEEDETEESEDDDETDESEEEDEKGENKVDGKGEKKVDGKAKKTKEQKRKDAEKARKIEEKKKKDAKKEKVEDTYKLLAVYYINLSNCHKSYAIKFICCEILNIVNVLGQMFFINRFLGGYFINYGVDVVRYTNMDQKDRIDPMIKLFPRMSKCTFHRFGSSGDVQKHDALCLLPLNIINEKIFVVMWFWFVILAVLGVLVILYRLLLAVSSRFRKVVVNSVSLVTRREIEPFLPISFGDWFMLHLIVENIEVNHFKGFLKEYREQKAPKDEKDGKDEKDEQFSKKEPYKSTECVLIDRSKSYTVHGNDSFV